MAYEYVEFVAPATRRNPHDLQGFGPSVQVLTIIRSLPYRVILTVWRAFRILYPAAVPRPSGQTSSTPPLGLSLLPCPCYTGRMEVRLFLCARCKSHVTVCSDCDRGQRYCSRECDAAARRESIRRAARRYQRTAKGTLNHARRQRRYRARRRRVTHQCPPVPVPRPPRSPPLKREIPSSREIPPTDGPRCMVCRRAGNGWYRWRYLSSLRRGRRQRPVRGPPTQKRVRSAT